MRAETTAHTCAQAWRRAKIPDRRIILLEDAVALALPGRLHGIIVYDMMYPPAVDQQLEMTSGYQGWR